MFFGLQLNRANFDRFLSGAAAVVHSWSGGTTGLTPSAPSTGNIVLGGVLIPANGGTGVNGFGLVTAQTASATLTAAQSYQVFTNEGAAGTVILTLPTAAAGLEFTAAVVASQTLILDVTGSVVIALGPGIESTGGGQISANEPGAFVVLKCLSATRWQAIAGGNGWTPS